MQFEWDAAQKPSPLGKVPSVSEADEVLLDGFRAFIPSGRKAEGTGTSSGAPRHLPQRGRLLETQAARKGECTMIVSYSITKDQKPTPEQIAEIREAAKRPIVFDEDCPEMTDEQLKMFKRVHPRPEHIGTDRKLG